MKLLLLSFSVYYFLVAIYTEKVNQAPWNFYNIYSLIIIAISALLLMFGFYKDEKVVTSIKYKYISKNNIILILIITIMWFAIRYEAFNLSLIWFDEATQYIPYWSLYVSVDCVKYAAMQQQMPLDYYTSYAFLKLFGTTVNALLFHSRLYGILSCLVLYQIFLKLKLDWKIILIGFCVFLSHATILRYSSEARPISLTIFLGLINLYYFYDYIQSKNTSIYLGLLPSSLLFSLSTGLQPLIQIFLLTFTFKIQSNNLIKNRMFVQNFLITSILASPLVWNIYQNTAKHTPNFKSQDLKSTISDLFSIINFNNFEIFFNQINSGLVLLVLLGVLYFSFKEFRSQNSKLFISFWTYFVTFPLYFVWIWSVMDWTLHPHYFAVWTVTLVVFCSHRVNSGLNSVKNRPNNFVKVTIFLLLICLSITFVGTQKNLYLTSKTFPDLRNLFKYENKNSQNVYINLPLRHIDDNGFHLDYIGPFYQTDNRMFWSYKYKNLFQDIQIKLRPDIVDAFNQFDNKLPNDVDLFIIVYCGMYIKNPFCDLNLTDMKIGNTKPEIVTFTNNYKVLIFRNQNNVFSRLHDVYNFIEANIPNSPWLLKYYQIKFRFHMNLHNYSHAQKYLLNMQEILNENVFINSFEKNEIISNINKILLNTGPEQY